MNPYKNTLALAFISVAIIFTSNSQSQTVSDYEGNVYGVIQIGNQKWLDANLRSTHFSNGDTILSTSSCDTDVMAEFEPKYYWAYNCNNSLIPVYGLLYTWYVAGDARNVCPVGWHVPSRPEYQTLETFLGGSSVAGGKLKETGTVHWLSPNLAATNEYNYNGVPNGHRSLNGSYTGLYEVSDAWTTTTGTIGALDFDLNYDVASTVSYDDNKEFGFAIRCVNDTLFLGINTPTNSTKLIDITVYPIPAEDYLNLQNPLNWIVNYQIISLSGQLLVEGKLEHGPNSVQIENLSAGMYVLQLQDSTNTITTRILVE